MKLSILNYGAGNLRSITNVLDYLNARYEIIDKKEHICAAEVLILPGVGHFEQLMIHLEKNDLIDALKDYLKSGKPYFGICLGMQILFDSSEEAPDKKGLGILPGKVIRFTEGKVPQIGWNKINVASEQKIIKEGYVYFVNSYCVVSEDENIIAAKTNYYREFVSAVQKDNIFATQFHPEKSGQFGVDTVRRWLEYVNEKNYTVSGC